MICEKIGIYDTETGEYRVKDVPYEIVRCWCERQKEELVEIERKKVLGIKVGKKIIVRNPTSI